MNQPKNHRLSMAFAWPAVLFWSTVATAFKLGLSVFSPAQLLLVASAISLLTLFTIVLLSGDYAELKSLRPEQYIKPLLLGLINPFAYYLVLFKAYDILPAQVAQPVNMVWPIILVLLSVPLLGKKVRFRDWIALLVCFFGVVLISSEGSLKTLAGINTTGLGLCLLSSVIMSVYWIFNQKSQLKPGTGLFLNFLSGTVALLLFNIFTRQFPLQGIKGFGAGIYIGIFETGISYWLWVKALNLSENTAKTANLIYLAPFLSLIFIHYFVGEVIHPTTLTGLVFIIAGIVFQQTGFRTIGRSKADQTEQSETLSDHIVK